MADLCSLDRTYISLLERGRRSPTLRTINGICRALGITLRDLFAVVEEELTGR